MNTTPPRAPEIDSEAYLSRGETTILPEEVVMPPSKWNSPSLLLAMVLILFSPSWAHADAVADHCLSLARKLGIRPNEIAFSITLPNGARVDHRAREPMKPASNMKLFVAVAALDGLGSGFMIQTDLWRRGVLRDGVLHGDLVVLGRGDPSFSGRYHPGDVWAPFRPWLGQLRELGIKKVEGKVRADTRYFSGPARGVGWPARQHHKWYSAPSGALNFNDNCVDVHIRPRGGSIEVSLVPSIARFRVDSRIRPVRSVKQHVYSVERAAGSWDIVLKGGFLASGDERVEWITVPDPESAFLEAFRALLREEGIVEGPDMTDDY